MFRFRSLEDPVDSLQVVEPVILHFNKLSKVWKARMRTMGELPGTLPAPKLAGKIVCTFQREGPSLS